MLVLTRKVGESVRIGGDIVLTLVQVGRGKVRLGIEAPKGVLVLRGELAELPVETAPAPIVDDSGPALEGKAA